LRFMSLLPRLWSNWITLLGSVVTTISGFGIIALLVIGLSVSRGNPYLTAVVVIVLPVAFGIGLALIGFGIYYDQRRHGSAPPDQLQAAFEAAFRNPSARRRILFVAVVTVASVAFFALAGHATLSRMESPQFCGSCHVMQPEWDAYNRSAHSNVACVDCHVSPTAAGLLKSKWNGVHQLVGVVTARYPRPIVAEGDDLPLAAETCETCHTSKRFQLGRVKLFPHYQPDKNNTPKYNAMLLRVGGLNPKTQKYEGIHWHANPDNEVRFEVLDPQRTKVGKITVLSQGKMVAEYLPPGEAQKPLAVRRMDCIDCHNRPTHTFDFTPQDAVDRAIFAEALDSKVPYLAAVASGLLGQAAAPRDGAEAWFQSALAAAYKTDHPEVKPDPAALAQAANTLSRLYLRNVYPAMNLTWKRHFSNTGHRAEGLDNPGCFRCHDGARVATLPDGRKKKLSQSCDMCHTGLAFDEDPAKFDDTLAAMIPGG
jgi:nitrate/TMAO reductase-like tetraheme cytochrome c subunit